MYGRILLLLHVLAATLFGLRSYPTEPSDQFTITVVDEDGAPLGGVRCSINAFEEHVDAQWQVVMRTGLLREFLTDESGAFNRAGFLPRPCPCVPT